MSWRVGCDIGGTFVDFAVSSNGNLFTGKYLSGPIDEVPNIVLRGFNDIHCFCSNRKIIRVDNETPPSAAT